MKRRRHIKMKEIHFYMNTIHTCVCHTAYNRVNEETNDEREEEKNIVF